MMSTMHRAKRYPVRHRGMLLTSGLILLSLIAAACSSGGSSSGSGGSSAPQAKPTVVVFAGAGGLFQTVYQQYIFDPFTKKTGIKVQYVSDTLEADFSKVQAGRNHQTIDVLSTNSATQIEGQAQGLFQGITSAEVPNLAQLLPISDLPKGDNQGVPLQYTAVGIEYNKAAYQKAGIPAPTSWSDLWNPKLKGHLALYDISIAYTQDLISVIAGLQGGSVSDFQPGITKLAQLKSDGNLANCPTTPAELDTVMQQGSIWATVNGQSRVADLKGMQIGFVQPKPSGGTFFENYLAIPKEAPHQKAAQELVNYMISATAQPYLAKYLQFGTVNKNAVVPADVASTVPDRTNLTIIPRGKQVPLLADYLSKWKESVPNC
jgi:putative spermidine/putrescine transport system substrate-binding protein